MPRYYDRDRRPEEGWAGGSRSTRRSGWEPVRMTGEDRDWDDDWEDQDTRDREYADRPYRDDQATVDRSSGWGASESRWGRGLRRAVPWGRGRDEGSERWGGMREGSTSGSYPNPRGARGQERYGPRWGEARKRWESDESRWATGPFTGVGPRGYQRSDDRIREDVCELLARHGQLDASNIEVTVQNGEVTLTGFVDSRWAKREAEDVADEAGGVSDVHNQLRVSGERRGQDRVVGTGTDRTTSATTGVVGTTGATATARQRVDIREGMTVVAADGDTVGGVKEVRGSDFLLDRPMQRDIYVPISLAQSTSGNVLYLSTTGDDLSNMNLEQPPLSGDEGDTATTS